MITSPLPWSAELVGINGHTAYVKDANGDKVAFVLDIKDAEAIVNASSIVTESNNKIEMLEDRVLELEQAIKKSCISPQAVKL